MTEWFSEKSECLVFGRVQVPPSGRCGKFFYGPDALQPFELRLPPVSEAQAFSQPGPILGSQGVLIAQQI